MFSPVQQTDPQTPAVKTTAAPDLAMELLALELSLDSIEPDARDFTARVRTAVADVEGVFLFELPASGLIANCTRIAVLRIPSADNRAAIAFACLEDDGTSIRLELPDAHTEGLRNFADAFVDVLGRI